jgi:uncharacterized membrane protein YhaH (DUF805 family)
MSGDQNDQPPASFGAPASPPPPPPPPEYQTMPGYGAPPVFPQPAYPPQQPGYAPQPAYPPQQPGYAPGYGFPPAYGGYPAPGYGAFPPGYGMGYAPMMVVPGQPTKRINRASYGILLVLFWAVLIGSVVLGMFVVKVPSVPVQLANGRTGDLTSQLIKTGDGCDLSITSSQCIDFWQQRGVTAQQLVDIDRGENKRLLFLLPMLPLIIPLVIGQARRHQDCGRSGWMVLINLIPCVGLVFTIINLVQEGQPNVNQYGPPPKSGVNWRSVYGGLAKS